MRSNLDDLYTLLEEGKHSFNVISLTETWLNDHEFKTNSNYHLPNYEGIHHKRKANKRGGGVLTFIRNDLTYKIRNDLCISDGDSEILTIELITKIMKNIAVSCCYKPLDGNLKNHCDHLQKILTNATMENKLYLVTGDFNLNCLNFIKVLRLDNFSITCSKKELFL